MNEVKLTDFTKEELKTAALAIAIAQKDARYTAREKEIFALWETQLINAAAVVSLREQVTLN
jgi:hypothetical protein